jgi:glycosyltransferase involved in cell wall biosynthesis
MSKIILDCDLMKYRNSGLYYYCLNLGVHVNKLLEERGEEPMRFYVPPEERYTFNEGRDTIVEKRYHRFLKPFLWDCKVWHAPFQSGRMIPGAGSSVKVVLTIHDLNHLHEGKPLKEQRESLQHTQALIDRSDVVVCISEFCRSDVLKHLEVKDRPVHVIHNGTPDLQAPQLTALSYRPRRPFLFAIGYVNRKKNFHVLLHLLECTDAELIVAGRLDEPDYVQVMKDYARRKGLEERLHILGPISDGEKAWYLKHCKAYVHPSLAEGFGATVTEAMAFGKPLFLSHLTSLPEIAGDVAFYFKNFEPDHMQQVFLEGMHYYSLNGLARRIIERGKVYNWRKKAAEYIAVYHSLL